MKVLNSKAENNYPKCLVLSPTRELCQQIQRSIQELVPKLKCVAVYGGGSVAQQVSQLSRGCDIICATPGRLKDLLQRRAFHKEYLELICLDEADELLTPNFLDQIEFVMDTDKERQVLMFSATISHNVDDLIQKYMKKPEFIDLTNGSETSKLPENVKHYVSLILEGRRK
jgi:superfamily II DNA/RNA helicase